MDMPMHNTTTVIANNETSIICEKVPNVPEFSRALRFGDHVNGVTIYFSGDAFERFKEIVNES